MVRQATAGGALNRVYKVGIAGCNGSVYSVDVFEEAERIKEDECQELYVASAGEWRTEAGTAVYKHRN